MQVTLTEYRETVNDFKALSDGRIVTVDPFVTGHLNSDEENIQDTARSLIGKTYDIGDACWAYGAFLPEYFKPTT